jgi:hypothetical protein
MAASDAEMNLTLIFINIGYYKASNASTDSTKIPNKHYAYLLAATTLQSSLK